MSFVIEHFSERLLTAMEAWPVDVHADYLRLAKLLTQYGPDLGLPHSSALGGGLFERRPRGRSGIGRAFYFLRLVSGWLSFMPSSRSHKKRPIKN